MKTILLMTLCILGASTAFAEDETNSAITQISLERTVCYGFCPIYTLTVTSDGTVVYQGYEYVAEKGKRRSTISKADFQKLAAKVQQIDFFHLDHSYREKRQETIVNGIKSYSIESVTDQPTYITTVLRGSITNSVSNYYGGPDGLTELENLIDEVCKSSRWIKVDENDPIARANRAKWRTGGDVFNPSLTISVPLGPNPQYQTNQSLNDFHGLNP